MSEVQGQHCPKEFSAMKEMLCSFFVPYSSHQSYVTVKHLSVTSATEEQNFKLNLFLIT